MLLLLSLFGVIGYGAAQSWVAPKEVIVGDAPTSCTNSITDTHVAFSFVALLGTIQGRKWVLVTDGVTTVQVESVVFTVNGHAPEAVIWVPEAMPPW